MAAEESLRPEMVQIAEHFLKSNLLKDRSSESIRSFLSGKGLSAPEIEKAFSNSVQFTQAASAMAVAAQQGSSRLGVRVLAILFRVRDFCSFAFFAAAAFYGLHFLYEHYLRPWLTGRPPPPPSGLQTTQLQEAVTESLAQLHAAVETLRRSVTSCTAALQSPQTDSVQALAASVNEMKKDVASLRSLLLKRTNFTPTPPVARSIPEWQKNGISSASSGGTSTSSAGIPSVSLLEALPTSSAETSSQFAQVLHSQPAGFNPAPIPNALIRDDIDVTRADSNTTTTTETKNSDIDSSSVLSLPVEPRRKSADDDAASPSKRAFASVQSLSGDSEETKCPNDSAAIFPT